MSPARAERHRRPVSKTRSYDVASIGAQDSARTQIQDFCQPT